MIDLCVFIAWLATWCYGCVVAYFCLGWMLVIWVLLIVLLDFVDAYILIYL